MFLEIRCPVSIVSAPVELRGDGRQFAEHLDGDVVEGVLLATTVSSPS